MAQTGAEKLIELAAAQITPTTEFVLSPVPKDAIVVLLDGMHQPILWKMLEKQKHEGGEFVTYFAAKLTTRKTRAINWRTATAMPEFAWDSGERVDQPLGVYAIKVPTPRALEFFGQNIGSEHQRRVVGALQDMYITFEYDLLFGRYDPAADSYAMDGLQALIPNENVVAAGATIDKADVDEAARIVATNGGTPRFLIGSPYDISAALQAYGVVQPTPFLTPEDWKRWHQLQIGIPTPYGVVTPLPHPLMPSAGTRSMFLIDPDTPTPEGPSLHIRYLIEEDPTKVEIPQGELAIVTGFMWIGALIAPGRYWQARIEIRP